MANNLAWAHQRYRTLCAVQIDVYFTLQNRITKFKMADGHHVDQYLFRFHWQ